MVNSKKKLADILSHIDELHYESPDNEFSFSFPSQQLMLVTAGGIIIGTPFTKAESDDSRELLLDSIFGKMKSTINEDIDDNDCPVLLLKDVQIKNESGNTFFNEYLYVFVDDIIGISICGID